MSPSAGQLISYFPWFSPTPSSPDGFNICASSINAQFGAPQNYFGYQNAKSGVGYAGIFATLGNLVSQPGWSNYREYIEVKLDSSLQTGQTYYVSFYVSLGDSEYFAMDNIGAYISVDSAQSDTSTLLLFVPQIENPTGNFLSDKLNWVRISGEYLAQGGEQFITIGMFKDSLNITKIPVIGGGHDSSDIDWYGGYYYIDDVCVSRDSLNCISSVGINEIKTQECLNLFPNPFSDKLTIQTNSNQSTSIILYDIASRKILEREFINTITINTTSLAKGIYLYEINNKSGVIKQGKVVKE